ncbi:MAG: hypothetical protein O2930_13525, partial [Acidobacteria bacterium]|nr:hypothetical protein [Acidobacteriota bacterium]
MPAPLPAPVAVRSLFIPDGTARFTATGAFTDLSISPDGRLLAYTAGSPPQIYVRRLDQLTGSPVGGASGVNPFFSYDGEWIGFVDLQERTVLRKVSLLGGPPVTLAKAPAPIHGITATADGFIFGSSAGPLYQIPDGGGEPTAVTTLDENTGMHAWPHAIPGTPIVLFVMATDGQRGAVGGQLAALNRDTGAVVPLKLPGLHPRWASTGHIVFATPEGTLRAVAFDPGSMTISGTPVHVADEIAIKPTGAANFDLSLNGHLVSASAGAINANRTIVSLDRAGRETPLAAPPRNYFYVRASPDGTRLSLDARDEEQDIWIWDLKRDDLSRLTDTPGADQYGLWAPNLDVVFSSAIGDRPELYRHR